MVGEHYPNSVSIALWRTIDGRHWDLNQNTGGPKMRERNQEVWGKKTWDRSEVGAFVNTNNVKHT